MSTTFKILGTPSPDALARLSSEDARRFVRSLGTLPKVPLSSVIPGASAAALDLLERMLTVDPAARITVDAALEHRYLAQFHDPAVEVVCPTLFNFDFEHASLDRAGYKRVVFHEVIYYHPRALLMLPPAERDLVPDNLRAHAHAAIAQTLGASALDAAAPPSALVAPFEPVDEFFVPNL